MTLDNYLAEKLDILKADGRYRDFAVIECDADFPDVTLRRGQFYGRATVWCANNYLGLAQSTMVKGAAMNVLNDYSSGAGGTRNIAGTRDWHDRVEQQLAQMNNKPAALLFTSGYVANWATLATLGRHLPQCIFLSDEKNHNSIIEGIRAAGCGKVIFKHNDMDDLRDKIKHLPANATKIIVTEGLFSMDGDSPALADMVQIAKDYGALTYVDEVHAVGIYGARGSGIAEQQGVADEIDIVQGTLGKALASMGGYVAASRLMIDFIRSHANGFIFTTSLPPVLLAAASAAINWVMNNADARHDYLKQVKKFQERLWHAGLIPHRGQTHLSLVPINNPHHCNQVAHMLLERGVYVQPINYPTVPKGAERFRITLTPRHTRDHETHLIDELSALTRRCPVFNHTAQIKA